MTDGLPDDLIMPCTCPACGEDFNVPAEEVVLASTGRRPIPCPHCHGAQLGIRDIREITFFSLAEWEAWDDTDPDQEAPGHYHIAEVVEVQPVFLLPPMSMN